MLRYCCMQTLQMALNHSCSFHSNFVSFPLDQARHCDADSGVRYLPPHSPRHNDMARRPEHAAEVLLQTRLRVRGSTLDCAAEDPTLQVSA